MRLEKKLAKDERETDEENNWKHNLTSVSTFHGETTLEVLEYLPTHRVIDNNFKALCISFDRKLTY